MKIIGPTVDARSACEAILRSAPQWFGVEASLLMYAADSARLPTFAATKDGEIVGFVCLTQHFPQSWEIHCIAVHAAARGKGIGRSLVDHATRWLFARGVTMLQVKTIAASKDDSNFARTRDFYAGVGFTPLEVFPTLWGSHNPCLQLVKVLSRDV